MDDGVREFTLGLKEHADRLDVDINALSHAVALRALNGVVLGTRVDTGRARGNWQVGVGTPPEGFDQDLKDKDGGATIGRGAGVIGDWKADQIIWLHDGVPYIGILESWDKMVEGNLEALSTWLDWQGWDGNAS